MPELRTIISSSKFIFMGALCLSDFAVVHCRAKPICAVACDSRQRNVTPYLTILLLVDYVRFTDSVGLHDRLDFVALSVVSISAYQYHLKPRPHWT